MLDDLMATYSEFIFPLLIMALKIPELCINSFRIILTAKGYKLYACLLIFMESLLGITALGIVITKLDNWINILAYALGMAGGSFLGIFLEKKIAMGIVLVRVIAQKNSKALIEHLRLSKFRVTEVKAESNFGKVSIIFAVVKRNNVNDFVVITKKFNPNAFFTIEELSHVSQLIAKSDKQKVNDLLSMSLERINPIKKN